MLYSLLRPLIFRLDPDGLLRYARGAGLSQEFIRDMAVPVGV
jgi:hypothetical protein